MRALANQQIVEDATKANGFGLEEFRAAQLSVLDEIATALLAEARRRGIEGAQARLAATRGVGEVASPSLGASRMRSLERALRARTEQAAATGPVREPPARASPQRGTPKATSPAKGGALQADVKAKRKEKTMAETNGSEGKAEDKDFWYLTVPRAYSGSPSVRGFHRKSDGQERAVVTLPPGTIIPGKLGSYDASFYQIYVSASSVKAWDDDPSNYSVAIPKANKNGEPKQVLLSRQEGHWENPEAEGPERGQYIVDSEKTMRVDASVLCESLQKAREARAEYVKQNPDLFPDHELNKVASQEKAKAPKKDASPSADQKRATASAQARSTEAPTAERKLQK